MLFLKKNWIAIAGGLAGLIALITIYLQSNTIASLKGQLEASRAETETATLSANMQAQANANCNAVVAKQSKSIEDLATAAEANKRLYREQLATARETASRFETTAEQLLALQGPEGELEQCRAARDLLEKELVE